jgi:hypothetical protein
MKVFISSLITGMEPLRAVAREAVTAFRHEAIMAEDFGAQASSPQVACLTGLRNADVVILILGERYGAAQASGLSATHEEYEEAKGRKYVFAFVQEVVDRDPQQAAFVREVQSWESGLFRGGFKTADDLRQGITRALYDHALANATGPVDQAEMAQRAVAFLPEDRRGYSGAASLNLAVAGGPRQSILRPVELEKRVLADALIQRAFFGAHRLFDLTLGVQQEIEDETLTIGQERGAEISLNEQGSVRITLPVKSSDRMMPELIYEVVQKHFAGALDYASWVLDHVDFDAAPDARGDRGRHHGRRSYGLAHAARKRREPDPDEPWQRQPGTRSGTDQPDTAGFAGERCTYRGGPGCAAQAAVAIGVNL